jgi:ribose 5-phosphate isomerase
VTLLLLPLLQYEQISQEVEQIDGVITHGLLLDVADAVLVADPQGGVRELKPKSSVAAST